MIKKTTVSLLTLSAVLSVGSISPVRVQAASPTTVFVSIVPQKYFVERIGGSHVDVHVMVQPGASPATYEPKPKQMAQLSKTKIYFAIGVPFEKAWLNKIAATSPEMKVVKTDQKVQKIPMASYHHHEKESHEKQGEFHESIEYHRKSGQKNGKAQHEHIVLDPHIWLSPPLVKVQALAILKSLEEVDPSHRPGYEANYNQLVSSIDELDTQLKTVFAGKQGLEFMVFHPAWGYFASAYGLTQVPIEIEGKAPKPAQLKELIDYARKRGANVIFAQPQFSLKSAQLIAKQIGGEVVLADPLAEDWLANLRAVADKFKAALR